MRRAFRLMMRFFRSIKDALLTRVPSLEFSQDVWDKQYSNKQWAYLEGISELGRYSLISGYLGCLFSNKSFSVLEVGCGTGLLFKRMRYLPFSYYKGVDLSAAAIIEANSMADSRASFVAGDGARYEDNRTYDAIVFNEALYYFDDCLGVLKHYEKMISQDGFFVVSMVVGDVSRLHWQKIEEFYSVYDAVQIQNNRGITWNVKVFQPTTRIQ